jgi:hypothetical protein
MRIQYLIGLVIGILVSSSFWSMLLTKKNNVIKSLHSQIDDICKNDFMNVIESTDKNRQ